MTVDATPRPNLMQSSCTYLNEQHQHNQSSTTGNLLWLELQYSNIFEA